MRTITVAPRGADIVSTLTHGTSSQCPDVQAGTAKRCPGHTTVKLQPQAQLNTNLLGRRALPNPNGDWAFTARDEAAEIVGLVADDGTVTAVLRGLTSGKVKHAGLNQFIVAE